MDWNIWGLLWTLFEYLLIIFGIFHIPFLIVTFLLKQHYKPQEEPEERDE